MIQIKWIFILVNVFLAKAKAECDYKNKIDFNDKRIFVPLKGSNATGGFVKIKNRCANEVELTLKSAEGFKAVESHITLEQDGLMTMKKIDSFKIKAGDTLELVPGGKHLMFFDPIKPIQENAEIKLIFNLDKTEMIIPFKVISRLKSEIKN